MQKKSSTSVRIFYPRLDRRDILQILPARLKNLAKKLPLSQVILFGSYAKGNYTVGSDIDLLLIYSGKKQPSAYATVKKTLALPGLEPHLYAQDEYETLTFVIDRMIQDGIVLYTKQAI